MPRFSLVRCLQLSLLLALSEPCMAAQASSRERIDIPVALDGGAAITIETAWPQASAARALVVVVPGTGGMSDPALNAELRQNRYDPDHRGGLTARLLAAGYAVAYYNQRGYAPLRSCIHGDSTEARVASFVATCVDPAVRAGVTLSTITADTGQVFAALARHPRTHALPQLALAFSEGMHHVSTLAGQRKIDPVGIVAIGGPTVAISQVVWFQSRYEYFFTVAKTAFSLCADPEMAAERMFECARSRMSPSRLARMRAMIGAPTMTRAGLEPRQEQFNALYRAASEQFKLMPKNATLSGNFEGHAMPVAWNGHFAREQTQATTSSIDLLKAFHGRVAYLFGAQDDLIPLPATGPCPPRRDGQARTGCRISIVEGVGHGLEDDSGFMPARALDEVIRALGAVSNQAREGVLK